MWLCFSYPICISTFEITIIYSEKTHISKTTFIPSLAFAQENVWIIFILLINIKLIIYVVVSSNKGGWFNDILKRGKIIHVFVLEWSNFWFTSCMKLLKWGKKNLTRFRQNASLLLITLFYNDFALQINVISISPCRDRVII